LPFLFASTSWAEFPEAFDKQLAKAQSLANAGKHAKAAKAYARADALAEGRSTDALLGLALAHYKSASPGDTLDAAERLLAVADSDTVRQAGFHLVGLATVSLDTEDPELLAAGEDAFSQALSLSRGKIFGAHLGLAEIYSAQGKDAEAESAARRFIMLDPKSPSVDSARILACQSRHSLDRPTRPAEDFVKPQEGLEFPGRIYQPPGRAPAFTGTLDLWIDEMGCVVNVAFEDERKGSTDLRQHMMNTVYTPALLASKPTPVQVRIVVTKGVTAATLGTSGIRSRIQGQGQ
jgi:tetratricopeptide (TPR) repeat protein